MLRLGVKPGSVHNDLICVQRPDGRREISTAQNGGSSYGPDQRSQRSVETLQDRKPRDCGSVRGPEAPLPGRLSRPRGARRPAILRC
jgi:hypothetical protein